MKKLTSFPRVTRTLPAPINLIPLQSVPQLPVMKLPSIPTISLISVHNHIPSNATQHPPMNQPFPMSSNSTRHPPINQPFPIPSNTTQQPSMNQPFPIPSNTTQHHPMNQPLSNTTQNSFPTISLIPSQNYYSSSLIPNSAPIPAPIPVPNLIPLPIINSSISLDEYITNVKANLQNAVTFYSCDKVTIFRGIIF